MTWPTPPAQRSPSPPRFSFPFATLPQGRIEGTVRDYSGVPIANVYVAVLGLAHIGSSDSSGRYRLPRVPVGTHRLRATAVVYVALERDSVVIWKGVTTRVDFTLDRMWPGLGLPSTPASETQTTARSPRNPT
jgi:hypothetical protein